MSIDRLSPAQKKAAGITADIAFVGGGAANLIALDKVVTDIETMINHDPSSVVPATLTIMDRHGAFGGGGEDVYNHAAAVMHLNQPAKRMGITYADELVDWLEVRDSMKTDSELQAAFDKVGKLREERLNENQIRLVDPESYIMLQQYGPNDYIPRALANKFFQHKFEAIQSRVDTINKRYGFTGEEKLITLDIESVTATQAHLDGDGNIYFTGTKDVKITDEANPSAEQQTMQWQSEYQYDSVVVATGHKMNNILQQFRGIPGYADTPFSIPELQEALSVPKGDQLTVAIGTGQAFMDFVGVADALNVQTPIVAISGDLIEPWPRNHNACPDPRPDYTFTHFTKEAVVQIITDRKGNPVAMLSELRILIQTEMHCEEAMNADPQSVIKTFQTCCNNEFEPLFAQGCEDVYKEVCDLFKGQDANSTLPERYTTYQKFRTSHVEDAPAQLQLVQGRVDSAASTYDNGVFHLVVNQAGGVKVQLDAHAVVNTASINRLPWTRDGRMIDPLHQSMAEIGLAVANTETGRIDSAVGPRIAFIGAGAGGAFGVPAIRDNCQEAGDNAWANAVDRANKRFDALQPNLQN